MLPVEECMATRKYNNLSIICGHWEHGPLSFYLRPWSECDIIMWFSANKKGGIGEDESDISVSTLRCDLEVPVATQQRLRE